MQTRANPWRGKELFKPEFNPQRRKAKWYKMATREKTKEEEREEKKEEEEEGKEERKTSRLARTVDLPATCSAHHVIKTPFSQPFNREYMRQR
jgi:hypothetical protein